MRVIGIDVGGTNTDAVLLADRRVARLAKTPTTPDVTTGITTALRLLMAQVPAGEAPVDAVMVGTTLLGGILGGVLAIPLTAALRTLMFRYVWKRRAAVSAAS